MAKPRRTIPELQEARCLRPHLRSPQSDYAWPSWVIRAANLGGRLRGASSSPRNCFPIAAWACGINLDDRMRSKTCSTWHDLPTVCPAKSIGARALTQPRPSMNATDGALGV